MARARHLTKEEVLAAVANTKSNKAAARYLSCSYIHYKKWAKFYKDEATGKSLFELHLNQCGKGIPKFLRNGKKETSLIDIIEGRIDASSFGPEKIKNRMIAEGFLKECCSVCGFNERRVLDYKMPLVMHFKDNNRKNYRPENLQLLCYNCYYLNIGDIFTSKQIQGLEDHKPVYKGDIDWEVELDDYQREILSKLNLDDYSSTPDDGSEFISRL
jgi:hypothetical protein